MFETSAVVAFLVVAVVFYGMKRFFDDRAATRSHESHLVGELRELPKRIATFELSLKEAISQMFEFAKLTQRAAAEKAGAVARASVRPKP